MSRADQVGSMLEAAFPGLRVSSTDRTPAEQKALVARGATRAVNSQHLTGNGIDVVLPSGVTPGQVRTFLRGKGITPGEFLNESGKGQNQGTGSHLHIGLAPRTQAKGGDPASSGVRRAASPSQNVQAWRDQQSAGRDTNQYPDIRDVLATKLKQSTPIPNSVIASYNSHKMEPEDRAIVDKYVADGTWFVPKGQRLQAPAPRTAGELLGMGTRNVMEGAGGLVDVLAGPLNTAVNTVAGTNLSASPTRDLMRSGADAMGLAKPESDTENLYSAAIEGGTQGLLTAGAGTAVSGAQGATGVIGRAVAASPLLDTVSGVTSGVAAETARQAGVGPTGQMVAGLAGGLTPVGLAKTAERIRAPKTLPDVVAQTPREVMMTPDGELTPHGQEIAARHGATPDEVRQAYEAPPSVQRGAANDAVPQEAQAQAVGAPRVPDAPEAPPRPVETDVPPASRPAEAVPAPSSATPDVETLPATALDRVNQAQEFGVDMSRGQATKNFDIQDKEQRLRGSNGPEGDTMRAFVSKQNEQVKAAVDDFKQAMGDTGLTTQERGQQVQAALRELRDNGQEGVKALYKQAREMGEPIDLDTTAIRQAYDRVMVEANVPDSAKAELTQEMARYGLVGKAEVMKGGKVTAENGVTTVKLDNGQTIKFYGEPQSLRLDNAEEFRKVVSDLYRADGPRKLTQLIKRAVDDAVEEAAVKVADGTGGNKAGALAKAREAHVDQVKTFRSKDVIQDLIDWKKGAEGQTPKIDPEQVMTRAFRSTGDLKRVKAIMLSKPTVQSKAAWEAIKGHGVATVFDQATVKNANVSGEITEAISGAKLRTAIDKFGVDKLKVLLDADQFNTLMRLRRTIEDVTIPITGTTNPSASGLLVMRLMSGIAGKIPGAGGLINMGAAVVGHAKQVAERAATVKGLDYTSAAAAAETAPAGAGKAPGALAKGAAKSGEFIKGFIDTFKTPDVLTPVLVASEQSQRNDQ